MFRLNPSIFLFSEQDSLGGHRDSAKMAAAITERFTNQNEFYLFEPFSKISGSLFSSDGWRVAADVILLVDLPPRIEDGAGRRVF